MNSTTGTKKSGGLKIETELGKSGLGKWGDACKHCGKVGHTDQICGLLKNKVGQANTIEIIHGGALSLTVDSALESWIFSTAVPYHCSAHKGIFEKYTAGNYGKASAPFKNARSLDIVGKGEVRIKLPNGARWVVHDVFHIPGLARNLISVGQLMDEGYALQMSGGSWTVLKGGEKLFTYEFVLPPNFVSMMTFEV